MTAPHLSATATAADTDEVERLLAGMTLADKAGMLFHPMTQPGPDGTFLGAENLFGVPSFEELVLDKRIRHFNIVGTLNDPRATVHWHNAAQRLAIEHGGIPITFSTDPRHSFTDNVGTGAAAGFFSQWPEPLGLAAINDEERIRQFADIARQEYLSVGLRVSLHPQIDLATEPRWSRIDATFGESVERTGRLVRAYIDGFQGAEFGAASVSTMTKHFPGGGPQRDGEDPHFAYGREQVYPSGQFELHLQPFRDAIAAGTRQMMPSYGMPIGTPYEPVAFGFNKPVLTDLLRDELGFTGIVCADWGILTASSVFGQARPARAWGLEHLTPLELTERALHAGIDQFGGEHRPDLVIELVRSGRISESRVDASVRRLLLEKLQLGLFARPLLTEDAAVHTATRVDFRQAGEAAQRDAVVVLEPDTHSQTLPLTATGRVYAPGIDDALLAEYAVVAERVEDADIVLVRLDAPYEPRSGGFEQLFHAGSLAFTDRDLAPLQQFAATHPLIVDVHLDRPAILTPLTGLDAALTVSFGVSDRCWLDVVFGRHRPSGTLPFDLPRSMDAVLDSPTDAPFATEAPLYRFGAGGGFDGGASSGIPAVR